MSDAIFGEDDYICIRSKKVMTPKVEPIIIDSNGIKEPGKYFSLFDRVYNRKFMMDITEEKLFKIIPRNGEKITVVVVKKLNTEVVFDIVSADEFGDMCS